MLKIRIDFRLNALKLLLLIFQIIVLPEKKLLDWSPDLPVRGDDCKKIELILEQCSRTTTISTRRCSGTTATWWTPTDTWRWGPGSTAMITRPTGGTTAGSTRWVQCCSCSGSNATWCAISEYFYVTLITEEYMGDNFFLKFMQYFGNGVLTLLLCTRYNPRGRSSWTGSGALFWTQIKY